MVKLNTPLHCEVEEDYFIDVKDFRGYAAYMMYPDPVDAAKAAANKALETDAEECPKGDVAAITDSDIKEYFSDAPEYYAGKKDVYGGRHYHNVYAVFRMTM